MDICRICMLNEDTNFISIFSSIGNISIATTIISSCSVQLSKDDGLPSQICESCAQDVQMVHAFIDKVRTSDCKLREIKNEKSEKMAFEVIVVKTESIDEDQCVNSNGDAEQNPVEFKSEEESEDDKLSTIRARVKKAQLKKKKENESPKKSNRKRKSKAKVETDDEFDEDNDNDVLDEKELEMFESIKLPEINYVCCGCYQYFETSEELEMHIEVHKKFSVKRTDTIHCEICKRRFNKPKALDSHSKKFKTVTKIYECLKCKARFISAVSRRRHAHRHPTTIEDKMKKEYGAILCCVQGCTKSFASEELLVKHSQETHKLYKLTYKAEDATQKSAECPVCFKRFASEILLRRHRKRNSKPMDHQCAICGLKFRTKDVLTFHEMNHAEQKPFQCEICKKYFSSNNALKVHQRYHSNEKPFVCVTCGAGFYQMAQLVTHEYDHGNTPLPFQCEVCDKYFKMKSGLINHMRMHTGERPFPCRHCSMSFSNHTTRHRHEMNHTGNKPFKCTYCDQKFTIKRLQLEHECKHTGIKPYKCTFCDKTFIRKRFQVDHESSHTGVKPYRCDMCNRSFSQKSGLRRHLESHPLAPENAIALAAPSPMPAQASTHMVVGVDSSMSPPPVPMAPMNTMGDHPGPSSSSGSSYFQHPQNVSADLHSNV
ncbi:oocyte zinc finger protein XlCOF6-like isoform X2 [Ochlerotatus camptorhynchus]|uniref:oocyte zinc finger protein XlCOF6-like isoform X2 n=1 Tax=Ochlerotatus camptorhynchus TaxID=644619 RepID=UPI0031DCE710